MKYRDLTLEELAKKFGYELRGGKLPPYRRDRRKGGQFMPYTTKAFRKYILERNNVTEDDEVKNGRHI
jgi:hypothetical protein